MAVPEQNDKNQFNIEYWPDGSIKSIGGVTQGVLPIADDVARKVMGDLVPPAAPIDHQIGELEKIRHLAERQYRATEKVVDLLADILKELKSRK